MPSAPGNPLRDLIHIGKMPTILELHLTEADRLGYAHLRQRYLRDATALPNLAFLGQYLRQIDLDADDLSTESHGLASKLLVYADLLSAGRVDIVALDDQARGRPTLDNAIAAELLLGLGVDPRNLLVNMVARNRTATQIRSRLLHFSQLGLKNALLLTGDLPVDSTIEAKFPLDAIGMCELARGMMIEGALPDDFLIAAAGHPNEVADPGGMRTLHKALAGARIVITQAIYDVDAFARWMEQLHHLGVIDMVHVMAEVIPMTSSRQLSMIQQVPGISVPDELVQTFSTAEDRIATAAQTGNHNDAWRLDRLAKEGNRLTRTLLHRLRAIHGVSGFYLGCIKSYKPHLELLRETPLVPDAGNSLTKLTKLTGPGRQHALAALPGIQSALARLKREVANHETHPLQTALRAAARIPATESLLKVLELPKLPIFDCQQCDRCDLSVDALVCPRGCAKQMTHGPCGAPRRDGDKVLCEDSSRECTWAKINEERDRLSIPQDVRLSSRPSPSEAFYQGKKYSAFLPVLQGQKDPPDWTLAYRAPAAWLKGKWNDRHPANTQSSQASESPDLITLIKSRRHQILTLIKSDRAINDEELLVKALAFVGTPAALYLIEARLAELGIPAEGTIAELSIREQFLLAEAIPKVREKITDRGGEGTLSPLARSVALLRALPEKAQLRRAMRHEMANTIIRHIGALGVMVKYTDAMLLPHSIESFLRALPVLKDELNIAGVSRKVGGKAGKLSVKFDRVPYKHHFRKPVALRVVENDENAYPQAELVVDIKQFKGDEAFRQHVRHALASWPGAASTSARGETTPHGAAGADDWMPLEPFAPESQSVAWKLNSVFWERLRDFEEATGISYDASIGGSTDHNLAYVRSTARAYFDRVHQHGVGHESLCILEIGVASVGRAITFLEEFKRICDVNHVDYVNNTTYLLADFSAELLEIGASQLREHHPLVETIQIDAGDPSNALSPYQGRIMHAHLCNVYDNLPASKLAIVDGNVYQLESRLGIERSSLADIAQAHSLSPADVQSLQTSLASLGEGRINAASWLDSLHDLLSVQGRPRLDYVHLWISLFQAMTFEERYVRVQQRPSSASSATSEAARVAASSNVEAHPTMDAKLLALAMNVLNEYGTTRDVEVHANVEALGGFCRLLPLLHRFGVLEVVDIFARRLDEYRTRHMGPAKYDGSTVNWLNGPLFRAAAEELGYSVRFDSFKPFDPKSASVILLAGRGPDKIAEQG
ncbi:MAG: methylenetetrahydrofolate reductase C-terminal domain-containing protein [Phycisphaerae bacterium]